MKSILRDLFILFLCGECGLLSAGDFYHRRQKPDLVSRYRQLRAPKEVSPEEEVPEPEEVRGMQRSRGRFRALTPGEEPEELFDIEPRLPLQTDE